MCEATTMIGLLGSAVSAVGSIAQGMAAASASKYNAKVQEMNAAMSERRAKDADARGKAEEQKQREAAAQLKGRQIAAMAANGLDVGFGSPLDTISDTAALAELDALTIRRNTAREAYDFKVDAVNQRAGATLSRMNASAQTMGGYLSGAGTILGGLSSAYQSYQASRIGSVTV